MAFTLGRHSRAELIGVHPALVDVVELAIERTQQDFTVFDGLRTEAEQAEIYGRGSSHVAFSKHQRQADNYGHAVDLVPFIAGKVRWELRPACRVAMAVRLAARELAAAIRWGGGWCRLDDGDVAPAELVSRYVDRCRAERRDAFVDACHFELIT